MHQPEKLEILFASTPEEAILTAEICACEVMCCQIVKKEAGGPVLLAFYGNQDRRQIRVDPMEFMSAVNAGVEEINLIGLRASDTTAT